MSSRSVTQPTARTRSVAPRSIPAAMASGRSPKSARLPAMILAPTEMQMLARTTARVLRACRTVCGRRSKFSSSSTMEAASHANAVPEPPMATPTSASASAGAGGGGGARASPGAGGESGGGAASSFDAPPPTVVADNVQSALGAAPFCVLLPHGSAAYASSGCSATARVLRARYASEGSQTFYFATLDIHQDDGGSVVLRHIQLVLRQCGCVALRRSSDIERTRAAVYTGPMSPEALSSWLDRLIGGEIPLAYLVQSG
mmetsp:Transcript_5681/g.13580  ORF Transcript_5681/g.13580 Transcript_5681/m.13580 type:complete len:259 (-) Transcript_5681:175-951(-)